MSIYSRFISSNVASFLRSLDHFISPAKFYVIPKIHKNPIVGRPIAASHSYIARPLSIFIEYICLRSLGILASWFNIVIEHGSAGI